MIYGTSPLEILALAPADFTVAAAVIRRADELALKRQASAINAAAAALRSGVEVVTDGN